MPNEENENIKTITITIEQLSKNEQKVSLTIHGSMPLIEAVGHLEEAKYNILRDKQIQTRVVDDTGEVGK